MTSRPAACCVHAGEGRANPPRDPRLRPARQKRGVIYRPCGAPDMAAAEASVTYYYYEDDGDKTVGQGVRRAASERSAAAARLGQRLMRTLGRRASRVFVGAGGTIDDAGSVELYIDQEDPDCAMSAKGERPRYLRRTLVAVPKRGGRRVERELEPVRNPAYLSPRCRKCGVRSERVRDDRCPKCKVEVRD